MAINWLLENPTIAAYLLVVLIGVVTYLDYRICHRLGWPFGLRWALAGCAIGLTPAVLAVAVFGLKAAILGAVALLALVGVMLWIGEETPEKPDWDKYGGEPDGA